MRVVVNEVRMVATTKAVAKEARKRTNNGDYSDEYDQDSAIISITVYIIAIIQPCNKTIKNRF